jgi:hypothetical protein
MATDGARDRSADIEPIRVTLEEARIEVGGALRARGWAVAARGLRRVEVFHGQRRLGSALTGLPRPDVSAAFPDYPGAFASGFEMTVSLPAQPTDAEIVTAVAIDLTGEALSAWRLVPGLAAMLVTLEEARIDERGMLTARGWAVAIAGIERVRVFLDATPLGAATHNLSREDVRQAHPAYPNAHLAGFLLRCPAPEPTPAGQTLRIEVTAGDGSRREATAAVTSAT